MAVRVPLRMVVSWVMLHGSARAPAQTPPPEHHVKAEFIERFTRFIDWPQHVFANPDGPFIACFAGKDGLGPYFADLAKKRSVKGRRIHVRGVDAGSPLDSCHLLFIGRSEQPRVRLLLSRTSGKPILTIGDTHGYGEAGVLINLFLEDGKYVRFQINASEVVKSGLVFSSKLMKLAERVSAGGQE